MGGAHTGCKQGVSRLRPLKFKSVCIFMHQMYCYPSENVLNVNSGDALSVPNGLHRDLKRHRAGANKTNEQTKYKPTIWL